MHPTCLITIIPVGASCVLDRIWRIKKSHKIRSKMKPRFSQEQIIKIIRE